jgi:hypothetical protein
MRGLVRRRSRGHPKISETDPEGLGNVATKTFCTVVSIAFDKAFRRLFASFQKTNSHLTLWESGRDLRTDRFLLFQPYWGDCSPRTCVQAFLDI